MKAAFLSSSLIASKGTAGPVSKALRPGKLLERSSRVKQIYAGDTKARRQAAPSLIPTDEMRAHQLLNEPKLKPELREQSQNLKKDALGRVRMSVRMTTEQHLHLKLIAAHAHLSAQAIIEQALDEYVTRHGTDLIPNACNCIKDKIFS